MFYWNQLPAWCPWPCVWLWRAWTSKSVADFTAASSGRTRVQWMRPMNKVLDKVGVATAIGIR